MQKSPPNGLSVLRDLSEAIFAQVANSGYPVSHFHPASARGRSLARIGATNQRDPELHTVLISRQRLWDCLRQHVPDKAINDRREVSGIIYTKAQRPAVQFADGSADLEADLSSAQMVSRASLRDPGLWSTHESSELPNLRNFDKEDVLTQLKVRHAGWVDPVVHRIVDGVVINSVYPTWITPEMPTWHARGLILVGDAAHAMQPSSGQGTSQGLEDVQVFSMLLAHHLERNFSQSASRVGNRIPASVNEAVNQASKEYFELRRSRVKCIVDRAKQMDDTKRKKGLFEEYLTYLLLWIIGKYLSLLRFKLRGMFRRPRRIPNDMPGLLPVDTYTKQIYNDLPIYEVRRVIEADKSPAVQPAMYPS
ncbi:MAG: hypothetical protein Q9207_006595 [Kuettlingeria erythrocarpa]